MKISKEELINNGFELISANDVEIKKVEPFNDDYVYDIEVNDNSHTFCGNDILLHNSIYVRMDAINEYLFGCKHVDWDDKEVFEKIKNYVDNEFQQKINSYCADFICNKFYTDQRRIEFKREKLSAQGEYFAKKRYIVHVYNDEGLDVNKWAYTGVDIKKNELPNSVKQLLEDCVKGLIEFDWNNEKFQKKLKEIYDIYETMSIKDLAYIKNYNTPKNSTGFLTMEKGAGAHAKAVEYYNQIIKELKIEHKYDAIQQGERFHYIYIKRNNKYGIEVIGFKDRWPEEFNKLFEIDRTKMFEKEVLSPLKTIISNHNYATFNPSNIVIVKNKSIFDI